MVPEPEQAQHMFSSTCPDSKQHLQTIKIRKDIWIGHIWSRSCLLEHVIGGKIRGRFEVTGRQRKRFKKFLYDI